MAPKFALQSQDDPFRRTSGPRPFSYHRLVPPKSRLGQNFLRDPQAIRRIVAALGDCGGRTVVEIGPGMGAITRELAAKAGKVLALEVDRELAASLSAEFAKGSAERIGAGSNVELEDSRCARIRFCGCFRCSR